MATTSSTSGSTSSPSSRRPQFLGQEENANIPGYLGGDGDARASASTRCWRVMDELGVATGILTPGLDRDGASRRSRSADAHPGRFLVAGGAQSIRRSPTPQRAPHPRARRSTRASRWCA